MELAVYMGTASALSPNFRKARARQISASRPRSAAGSRTVHSNVAAAIVADIPELAGRGIVERSPSPDGPLAVGFVA